MSELIDLKTKLQTGRMSRREFMGRAAALGASTAVISSLLASADAYAADTPRKGGVLRLGLGGGSTTDSVDITSYNDSVMIDVSHGLFDGLVEWGEDGKPKPDLAASFEPTNGAKDWIFNLRKGIKFSNGQEFTADDALYSINLHRGDSKSGGAGSLKPITDVKKLDKYQIQISLDAGRRRPALRPHRLPRPDGAGRVQGLGEAGGDRRLLAREVRPRRPHHAEEDPGLLEGGARPPRRGGGHRHQ